jgi:outer membrane protein OmpA-like peptidoglycan-associated protein
MINPMRTVVASALLAGSAVLLAPGLSANAQNLAAAAPSAASDNAAVAKPRPGYVVFFERGSTELSPTANDTIRLAADASRAKKSPIIRIVGRADLAEAVKSALVLRGVLPTSIALVGREDTSPIVRASTGAVEPVNRSVLIAF